MIKKLAISFFILSLFLFSSIFLIPKEYYKTKVNITSKKEFNVSFGTNRFSSPYSLLILNPNQTFVSLIFKEENVSYYVFSPENWMNFTSSYIFYGNTSTTIPIKNHSEVLIIFENHQKVPKNFSVTIHQFSILESIRMKNDFWMYFLFDIALILLVISVGLAIFSIFLKKRSFGQVDWNY